jgi:predicted lipoprotein
LAGRLDRQFPALLESVSHLNQPLDSVAREDMPRLTGLYQSCKELELLLKLDLASVLGVTLTFTSTDGD